MPGPLRRLRLIRGGSLSNLALLVAQAHGFLSDEGLRGELVPIIPVAEVLEAFARGEAEAGVVPFTAPLMAGEAAAGLVIVAGCGLEGLSVLARPEVRAWRDLVGGRAGTLRGGPLEVVLVESLERAGLTREQVRIEYVPSVAVLEAALGRGDVDAGAMVEPFASRLVAARGLRRLGDGRTLWGRHPDTVLAARRAFVTASREVLVAVIRALCRGQAFIEAHPLAAAAMVEDTFGMGAEALADAIPRMPPGVDIRDLAGFFPARAETLRRLGYIESVPPGIIDFSLLDEVLAAEKGSPGAVSAPASTSRTLAE